MFGRCEPQAGMINSEQSGHAQETLRRTGTRTRLVAIFPSGARISAPTKPATLPGTTGSQPTATVASATG